MIRSSFLRTSGQIVSLGLLTVFGLGCGLSPNVQVQDDGSTINVQGSGNDAVRLGQNITIPDTFPPEVPRYPGATTQIALKDAESYTLSQETSDEVDTVIRALDQQMTQQGFTLIVRIGNPGEPIQLIDYGHEAKQLRTRVQVTRDPDTQKTRIMVAQVHSAS